MTAILRDERDLIWLVLDDVRRIGGDVLYDVHFLAREAIGEPPAPFLSAGSYREPAAGLTGLLDGLAGAVVGDVRALRHDPITDGLSLELKFRGEASDLRCEVVAWLDLTRMGPALKSRAVRGRHQSGLRFFATRAGLEEFRDTLFSLAFPAPRTLE